MSWYNKNIIKSISVNTRHIKKAKKRQNETYKQTKQSIRNKINKNKQTEAQNRKKGVHTKQTNKQIAKQQKKRTNEQINNK